MRFVKISLIVIAVLFAVVASLGTLASRSLLTKEMLVKTIESKLNCKASAVTFETSLFSFPSSVSVSNLRLTPTDPAATSTELQVDRLQLKASLASLWTRRFSIDDIVIDGLHVRDEISKEGRSPLAEMFQEREPPSEVNTTVAVAVADPAPAPAEPLPNATQNPPPTEVTTSKQPTAPEAKPSQAAPLLLKQALVDHAFLHLVDRRAFTKTDIDGFRVRLQSSPDNPTIINAELSGHAKMTGRKKVGDKGQDVQILDLPFTASGEIAPLDAPISEQGRIAEITLTLPKGALLGGHLTMGEAGGGKDEGMSKLKEYLGVDLSGVPLGGVLQNEAKAEIKIAGSRIEWLADTQLEFPDYTFVMQKGSWMDEQAKDSRQQLRFTPSRTISDQMMAGITGKYGDKIARAVLQTFDSGKGGLEFQIILTGPRNKPKTSIPTETMNRAIKAISGDLLKGLLGN